MGRKVSERKVYPHCNGFDYREEYEINLKCIKENVRPQRELEYLKSKLEEKEKLFLEAYALLKERDAEIKRLNELCSRLD